MKTIVQLLGSDLTDREQYLKVLDGLCLRTGDFEDILSLMPNSHLLTSEQKECLQTDSRTRIALPSYLVKGLVHLFFFTYYEGSYVVQHMGAASRSQGINRYSRWQNCFLVDEAMEFANRYWGKSLVKPNWNLCVKVLLQQAQVEHYIESAKILGKFHLAIDYHKGGQDQQIRFITNSTCVAREFDCLAKKPNQASLELCAKCLRNITIDERGYIKKCLHRGPNPDPVSLVKMRSQSHGVNLAALTRHQNMLTSIKLPKKLLRNFGRELAVVTL